MLFGGQKESATSNLSTVANKGANRLRVNFNASGLYDFQGWFTEPMLAARVMPDSVLLPNGKVVILSGAMVGDYQVIARISDCTDE